MATREGIQIRHSVFRSVLHVVDVPKKPYGAPIWCIVCRMFHKVKAVHLHLDDTGGVVVSEGVLDELRLAGMPDLHVVGKVTNPPLLTVGGRVSREEVDFLNRRQTIYNLGGSS